MKQFQLSTSTMRMAGILIFTMTVIAGGLMFCLYSPQGGQQGAQSATLETTAQSTAEKTSAAMKTWADVADLYDTVNKKQAALFKPDPGVSSR